VAPPALPTDATVVCPPCPPDQVCGSCPVGSSATRRSLQSFLPTWLGGKSSSSGDVTRYVVGQTSSLPRTAGGPTVYLSATACTECGAPDGR
jgi:hypothetical protein